MDVLTRTKSTPELLNAALLDLQPEYFKSEHNHNRTLDSAAKKDLDLEDERHNLQPPCFFQWRPSFHLLAPHGWLNDPCGPGYDPTTGLYHLSFQWNPRGNDWGNMSWGHAVSSDLVSWKSSPTPCLAPSEPYDREGVFTGCFLPMGVNGERDGTLTVVYTSVRRLPIHYSLPYVVGSESLSVAVSRDGGRTWERHPCNPILEGPPAGIEVTGWRDPFVSPWPSMQMRKHQDGQSAEEVLYGFISGGIAGRTPTVFVYAINARDLREWTYVGYLVDVGLNFRPGRWSGDFGVNWEVANVITLSDEEGVSRDFMIMGAEGCLPRKRLTNGEKREKGSQERVSRSQLWMSVKLLPQNERDSPSPCPLMRYSCSGTFDHGCYYAANSFWDPVSRNQIVYGWITEEDLPDPLRHRQGWSGLIALPRVVALATLRRVKRARCSELRSITSIETVPDQHGTYTVRTLGVYPDRRLERLRARARKGGVAGIELRDDNLAAAESSLTLTTSRWELCSEFVVGSRCARVGVLIAHSADGQSRTTISFHPRDETLLVERPQISDFHPRINHDPESAPHTLFTYINGQGEEVEEPLRIHAFFDTSVLEVFVNGRTAVSTRIYTPESSRCYGVRFFAELDDGQGNGGGGGSAAVLRRAVVWDGLEAV
ncbi:glycosyl hydrolase [Thermoascus aurantiacus ATCC 26904]